MEVMVTASIRWRMLYVHMCAVVCDKLGGDGMWHQHRPSHGLSAVELENLRTRLQVRPSVVKQGFLSLSTTTTTTTTLHHH